MYLVRSLEDYWRTRTFTNRPEQACPSMNNQMKGDDDA
jgi:hypothetical protein